MTGVDIGATIRRVLADCRVEQLSIAHVSMYGVDKAAFRVRVTALTVNPQNKITQLYRHFADASLPCAAITYGEGMDGAELRLVIQPMEVKA